MSDGTSIEWTDATLNVVNGCSVVSPGCTNCYAMRSGGRNLPNHPATGLTMATKAGHVWTGEVRFNDQALLLPLRWKRPRKIFWNAHGDLFHDNVPDEWIDRCFAVMALTPHHVHQVLTKRPERMREYMSAADRKRIIALEVMTISNMLALQAKSHAARIQLTHFSHCFAGYGPFPNVWLGVSVEDQQRADERIPILLDTPAAVRWISCEPLLGPVDLEHIQLEKHSGDHVALNALTGSGYYREEDGNLGADPCEFERVDWVVVGGESGAGARPMHPDWTRSLRDQCDGEEVPFLFKQWGSYAPTPNSCPIDAARNCPVAWPDGTIGTGDADSNGGQGESLFVGTKSITGRLLDGVQHDGYPA